MDLVQIVDVIEHSNIVYDNESLSLPYLLFADGMPKVLFFTYSVNFSFRNELNEYKINNRVVYDGNNLTVEKINITYKSRDDLNILIPSAGNDDSDIGFLELVKMTQNMIESDFSHDIVLMYSKKVNTYVPRDLVGVYMDEANDYFKFLENILVKGGI